MSEPSANVLSPRSLNDESSGLNLPTEGHESQNSTRSSARRSARRQLSQSGRSPRIPTAGTDVTAAHRRRLNALAKFSAQMRQNRAADLLRANAEKDNLQSRMVSQARERRERQMAQLNKSILYARTKQNNLHLVSEVEQERFFLEEFGEEEQDPDLTRSENAPEISPDLPPEDDDILPLIPKQVTIPPETRASSWRDIGERESASGIYVTPGHEDAHLPRDNTEALRRMREEDGLFVGSEPVISSNLRAWLARDGWMGQDGTPPYLEDTVYSYPVRCWTLPYGVEPTMPLKEPRTYLATEPLHEQPQGVATNTNENDLFYELALEIKQLKFTAHPLMGKEHLLQVRIEN